MTGHKPNLNPTKIEELLRKKLLGTYLYNVQVPSLLGRS